MFECDKCGKKFNKKHHLEYHVGRKRPCIGINIVLPEVYQSIDRKMTINDNNMTINDIKKESKIEKRYGCDKCDKEYKNPESLSRHKNKHKEKIDDNKNEIRLIKEENKEMKNKIKKLEIAIKEKTINKQIIHTQNNIQNNIINIIEYGKEDIRRLSKEDKYDILYGEGLDPLLSIIERVHFNENIPEQKNIKYTNIKSKYLDIHNGKIWQKELVTKIVNEIMDTNILNLDGLYNEYSERSIKKIKNTVLYSMNLIKNYNKYIDGEISDEEEINNKQNLVDKKDEVKLLLHNKTKEIYV